MIASKVFPTIYNNSNYRVKTITSYHPESMKYISYWRMHKKRVFEGCWIPDTKEVNIDLNIEIPYNELLAKGIKQWRWIPPGLYFYLNFGTILHKPENAPRTAPKQKIQPYLSDFDLAFSFNWTEARGFSGFEEDEEYTCNRDIILLKDEKISKAHHTCYNSKGELKKYITPREYLRRLSDKPLGKHLYFNEAKNLMLLGSRGGGKDLEENTIIYSVERGRIPIKDVNVGEFIYGNDGKPTKVLDKEHFTNQVQYRITTADGRSLVAGEGHLWRVIDNKGKVRVIETSVIRDTYKAHIRKKSNGKYNFDSRYFIPMNEAVDSQEVELPLNPYFVGLWLGDGNNNSTGITTEDLEIKEFIYTYCKEFQDHHVTINENSAKTCPTYSICCNRGQKNSILNSLRELNLLNNKHIPEIFFNGSIEQRLELLKGLMDTDGYTDSKHTEFYSTKKELAFDVLRLARSLGIRSEISLKKPTYLHKGEKLQGKLCYRVRLKPRINVFKLSRKANKLNLNLGSYSNSTRTKVAIKNVELVGVLPSVCIAVDNKDRCFLAGDYMVTHNSWLSAIHVLLHEIITDGSKYYTEDTLKNPPLNEIFVGAGIASKSAELTSKVEIGMNHIPGIWKKGTPEQIPPPLFKHMSGSLAPNNIKNPWRHEYDKKVAGSWQKFGTGSNIKHGVFTTENPEATAGGRYSVIVIEEVGLMNNVLTAHGSSEATQMTDGTDKYGSTLYIGCVCEGTKVWTNDGRLVNIEELTQQDGIVGYHSLGYLPQTIEKFTEPVEKPCYRISLEGGNYLECSEDHPILISKSKMDKNIDWEKYKVCTFRETKNIKEYDQVATITSVPIFGNKSQQHARLLGLLIGDGYIGKGTPELSVDSEEVDKYILDNYNVTKRKEFVTKIGYTYKAYSIKDIIPIMKETGIYNKTKDKKILPTDIDLYDKKSLSEFIGGYFDADGSVRDRKNGNIQIILTSNSKDLLEGVKYRLLKFGIESSIYLEKRRTGYSGGNENKYVLYISRYDSVIKFAENIKFLTKRKQDKLEKIYKQLIKKNSRTTNKLLYVGGEDGNFFEDSSIVEEIKFVRVKKIESIGNKKVYNLTAGGTHSYIANNIITHNTGGNVDKIVEAEIIFRDPEGFNMVSFEDEWENTGNIGWFVPAYYMDRKYKDAEGNTILDKAVGNYEERRKLKKKAKSSSALDLEMMNYPLIPSEMFLTKTSNNYPIADLKHRLAELATNDKLLNSTWKGRFGINSDGKVEWKNTDARPIREFPLKSDYSNMEGACEMFYPPQSDENGEIASGRYIAACLPPGEKVITEDGIKNIENVTLDDKLINSDGAVVKINKLIKYNVINEDIYTVKVANTLKTTTFTKEHPIFASKVIKKWVSSKRAKRLNINQRIKEFDFKYIPVEQLTTEHWIKTPNIYKSNNSFDINILWNSVPYRIDKKIENPLNNKDFWWFIGLWLGDGWTLENSHKISISFNQKETQYIEKFTKIVNQLFNRKVSYITNNGSVTATFTSTQLSIFLTKHFGKYAIEKKIPEWGKRIDDNLKLNLILGYLDSDGCIINKKYISTEFVSINLGLLESIQDILFSLGIISSIKLLRNEKIHTFTINEKLYKSNTKKTYSLAIAHVNSLKLLNMFKFPENLKISKVDLTKQLECNTQKQIMGCYFSEDLNYIYFKVDKIEKNIYSGIVHNFECETNTFMCYHITTHNCDPVDEDDNSDITTSLQSFLIMDTYLDRIVFEYSGRTKFAKDFYEQCRRALIYYKAALLYENQKKGVFTYFDTKNSLYLLADTPKALRDMDMQKISGVGNKTKGVYATPAINKWGREELGPAWMNSQAVGKPEGVNNAMVQKSPAFIREAILYNPNLNTDRISAFGILMIFRELRLKYVPKESDKEIYTPDKDVFWDKVFNKGKANSGYTRATLFNI